MTALWKSLACTALAAVLILPLPAFANSLHLASKPREAAPAASATQEGEPLVLPAEEKTDTGAAEVAAQPEAATGAAEVAAQPETDAQDENLEAITGLKVGTALNDVAGTRLVIPEGADDPAFLAGDWNFDHFFARQDGSRLRAGFSFDGSGRGTASFLDEKNVSHQANVMATVNDGVLKMQTSPYTSAQSSETYYPEFIECRNVEGAALCQGTDGFTAWSGEGMVGTPVKGVAPSVVAENSRSASEQSGAGQLTEPSSKGAGQLAELSSEGAELPPVVIEQAQKAKAGAVSALAGDWRYSRDLARKVDGESVALEFHFDNAGKGYSVIREGSGQEFKAAAEASAMKDGAIRVKTESYANGGDRGYFPTFMECRGNKSKELLCDVSNGWTRVEDGLLLSKNSVDEQATQVNMEELLPVASEAQSSAQSSTSAVDIAGMLAGLSESSAESSSSTSSAESSASTNTKQDVKQESKLVLPKKEGNMSFLEGHWRCNTGLARASDNQSVVVEFRFDKNGRGTASVQERSGRRYDASAQASYSKGELRINTSDFHAKGRRDAYVKSHIECRDHGGAALCHGENGGVRWSGATFTRLK